MRGKFRSLRSVARTNRQSVPEELFLAALAEQAKPLRERLWVALHADEVQAEPQHFERADLAHSGQGQQIAAVAVGVVALDLVFRVLRVELSAQHRLELVRAVRVQVLRLERGAERQPGP